MGSLNEKKSILTPDLTPAQCREARNFLRWSRDRLAARAGITIATLVRIEKEKAKLLPSDSVTLRAVFEEAGLEFFSENNGVSGVKPRKAQSEVFR